MSWNSWHPSSLATETWNSAQRMCSKTLKTLWKSMVSSTRLELATASKGTARTFNSFTWRIPTATLVRMVCTGTANPISGATYRYNWKSINNKAGGKGVFSAIQVAQALQTVRGAEVRELRRKLMALTDREYPISENLGANLFTACSGKLLAEKTWMLYKTWFKSNMAFQLLCGQARSA